jgi:hypothetical protein
MEEFERKTWQKIVIIAKEFDEMTLYTAAREFIIE